MYLYQSLFSDFISGIMLAINLFLWFFKYKKYVIIAVFDPTESGNAPSSLSSALFTDVLLTPKMCLQNLKRDFLWYNLVLSHTPKFQMKTKLLAW